MVEKLIPPEYQLLAKLVLYCALASALIGLGAWGGYQFEHGEVIEAQANLTSYKATQQAASEKALADQAQQVKVLQDAISQEAIQNDQKIQDAYHRNIVLARGLRICSGNDADRMPQTASAVAPSDAASQPGIISGQALADLARDADRDRETALECQRWAAGIAK